MDTGLDDALALTYLAHRRDVTLCAVTCVSGCVDVDTVSRNTTAVLATLGRPDVPVGRGSARPLTAAGAPAEWVFGPGGMGDVELSGAADPADLPPALEVMRRTLAQPGPRTTLVCTGPLTNVALLLRAYPEVVHQVEAVYVMGGSAVAGGNETPAAESNVLYDPEATDIVLRSGLPVVLYGLDVFTRVKASEADIAELENTPGPGGGLAARILRDLAARFATRGAFLGDAGVAVIATERALADIRRLKVAVELHGRYTRGATIVDRRETRPPHGDHADQWPFVDVVWDLDDTGVVSHFVKTITRGK
ncbi:nucleoside hydrolase [Nonomuraea rosea]